MAIAFHSDKALWIAFKKGSREALDNLFRSYYSPLYHYGLKIYGDPAFIEDSLQSFFLHLYDNREQLANLENIKPYLFKAYRRQLLRQIEKSRKLKKLKNEEAQWQPNIHFSADEIISKQEVEAFQKEVLLEMLHQLPNRQREVIYLRYYNNLSISEIAEVLSITYQGTANTLHKAIKTLRKDAKLKRIVAFFSLLFLAFWSFS